MNTIDMSDLILALASPETARGNSLTEMLEQAREDVDRYAMGVVIYLTGKVELYDLTAQEEPLLVYTARLSEIA